MSAGILRRVADWITSWKAERRSIDLYATSERTPFFREALNLLPAGNVTAIDVGGGLSRFGEMVIARNPSASVWILDGNADTVDTLKEKGVSALFYQTSDRIPFDSGTVDLIHCSHVIEHLPSADLYFLLGEFKRVLRLDGVLVISAPLMWERFYDDLSHVRPYPPVVLDKYLTGADDELSYSRRRIGGFRREALTYRYMKVPPTRHSGLRSEAAPVDLVLCALRKVLDLGGAFYVERTGFTATFRRASEPGGNLGVAAQTESTAGGRAVDEK